MSEELKLKKKEFELLDIQLKMAMVFRDLKEIPLDQYIEELDKALTYAPFLDPTLFMKKSDDGQRWLRIAKAFRDCRDKINEEFGR